MNLVLAGDNGAGMALSDFHPGTASAGGFASSDASDCRLKFFPLNGIQVGMAVLDVEMTQRCIARHHCRETNPVMPRRRQASQVSISGLSLATPELAIGSRSTGQALVAATLGRGRRPQRRCYHRI